MSPVLANRQFFRTLVGVADICEIAQNFHTNHAVDNRDAAGSAKWWSDRAADQGMPHVNEFFDVLKDGL